VAGGSFPIWNPSLGFGRPLLGDPSAQVAYPPTWLNLLLQPWDYYLLFALGHFLLAAFGLYALARRLGLSLPASTLAAVLFVFSGPYLSFVDLWHHFAGLSWMPLTLLMADRALEHPGAAGRLAWGAAAGVQMLAGSADAVTLTVLATLALAVARYGVRPSPASYARARTCAGAAATAAGLAAVMWLPAVAQVREAARAALPFAVRSYWSLHPASVLDFVYRDLSASLPLNAVLRGQLFESREPFLGSLYLGAAAVGFACAGALSPGRTPRALGVLGAAALLLAFGKHAPFYGIAAWLFPPLAILRYPVKVTILVALAFALLAGFGLDAWRRERSQPGWRIAFALQLAVGVLGLLAAAAALRWPETWVGTLLSAPAGVEDGALLAPVVRRFFVSGVAAVVVGAAAAAARGRPTRVAAAALLAVFELAAYHQEPNPMAPRALVRHRPEALNHLSAPDARVYVYDYTTPGLARRHLGYEPGPRLARLPAGWELDPSLALAQQEYLTPESGGRWGLRGSFEIDYRGLYPRSLDRLTQLLRLAEGGPAHAQLLRLAGVTHVVALHEVDTGDLEPAAVVPGFFLEPIRVFRVPNPMPRVYVVGKARVGDEESGLALLAAPDFDPAREVLLPYRSQPDREEGFSGWGRIVSAGADQVRLEAELTGPGYLVLLDGYDAGWRASVDGVSTPILRANVAFRALALGAGRHVVEMVYRPWPVMAGLAISGFSLALLAAGVVRRRRP
jgi:hypothetical protein